MLPEKNTDWRLFVAVSMPATLTEALHKLQEEISGDAGNSNSKLRWTHPEDFHLTLFFFGAVESARIPALSSEIEEVAATTSPFSAEVRGLNAFPDEMRARVLWAGLEDNHELRSLQKALSVKMTAMGFKDEKAFTPHVTLARARDGRSMERFTEKYRDHPFGRLEINELALYRSRPAVTGPRYEVLKRFPLRG